MQRLIARIKEEFSASKIAAVEIRVLNGSGDYLVIYTGSIKDISDLSIKNFFTLPGCFYFLKIISASHSTPLPRNEAIISYQRDLCWLSEPLPPKIDEVEHSTFLISWLPAKFCGFKPYSVTDSLIYTIEIKEGVSWKEGYICQHVNDVNQSAYKRIFSSRDDFEFQVKDLRSACWYHIRLEIEYLGIKVYSDVLSAHTSRGVPSNPSTPRITIIPVMNSFDINSRIPVRFDTLITWGSSQPNGSEITSYQVQMKTFDNAGHAKITEVRKSKASMEHERSSAKDVIAHIISNKKNYNQWIRSKGRNVKQIENCLRNRSPNKLPSIATDSMAAGGASDFPSLFSYSEDPLSPEQQPSSPVLRSTGWLAIYNNLPRRFKVDAPQRGDFAWHIRVRARNAEGWSAYSDVLVVDGFTHPTLFPLPSSSRSSGSGPDPLHGEKRRPYSSPAKFSHPAAEKSAPVSTERRIREEEENLAAEEDDNVDVEMLPASSFAETKSEVSPINLPPSRSGETVASKSALKPNKDESKNSLAKPKSSIEPTHRAKKGTIHFSPQVLEQDKGNNFDNGERSIHTISSSRESSSHYVKDGNSLPGDVNDSGKDPFTENRRSTSFKSNFPFQRVSSASSVSSNGSKGAKEIVNTATASQQEAISITQRNNRALEILMPFKDWR